MNVDYLKIYDELINFRKENIPTGYSENHHIIPRSLGGDDSEDNKVLLTGREHYIAHLLLVKIHHGSSNYYPMINAVWMMQMRCEERGIPKIKSSRMYEWVRTEYLKHFNKKAKVWAKGKNNSQYGTMWICNLELKENKKISKEETIPNGWIVGRNVWNKLIRTERKKEKSICNQEQEFEKRKESAEKLYSRFKNGNFESVTEFWKKEKSDITLQALCKYFKKYIPEYRENVHQGRKFDISVDKK